MRLERARGEVVLPGGVVGVVWDRDTYQTTRLGKTNLFPTSATFFDSQLMRQLTLTLISMVESIRKVLKHLERCYHIMLKLYKVRVGCLQGFVFNKLFSRIDGLEDTEVCNLCNLSKQ